MTRLTDETLRVAIVDSGLPNPDFDAGSQAILDFISTVKEGSRSKTLDLHFLAMGDNVWGRDTELGHLKVQVHGPNARTASMAGQASWLDALCPDIVVISRPGPASAWLSTVMAQSSTSADTRPRFFYYGHDIHHERLARQLVFDPQPDLEKQRKLHQALELAIWKYFDVVIYGSRSECSQVNRMFPKKAVHLPLYLPRELAGSEQPIDPSSEHEPFVLWVGGALHAPNRDALSWLVTEVMPSIEPPVNLHVVGDWPETLRQSRSYQPRDKRHSVHWRGQLDRGGLDEAYRECRFAIAPLRFGAGVKGKVYEAISWQCPVLTTPIGAQGLEHLSWPARCLSEAEPKAFAEKYEELCRINPRQHLAEAMRVMRSELIRERAIAAKTWGELIESISRKSAHHVH